MPVIQLKYFIIKRAYMTFTNTIFPRLSGLALAGKPILVESDKRPLAVLSRRELQRLIADMVD